MIVASIKAALVATNAAKEQEETIKQQEEGWTGIEGIPELEEMATKAPRLL
jgi:hypothetical protein